MERKISEIFIYKDKTYQAVEVEIDEECKGCAFEFSSCCTSLLGDCSPTHRTDGASVIFKEINNMENNQLTIDIPEGMEIDILNSNFGAGVICFKKKQSKFKDGDIVALVVRKCIHIAIFQSRQEAYIGFHAVLCQNDELLLEEPFREDVGDIELRLATDSEKKQLFSALEKEGKAWDSEKKMIVDLKPKIELKPFDKVVVRCGKADRWSIDFFSHKVHNGYICTGDAWFGYCLPYNDETAHLLGTTNDWEG